MEDFNHIGSAVRTARQRRGWSQERLGKQAGIPQSHIAKLEAGKDVRVSTLRRLLAALDYDLSFEPRKSVLEQPPANGAMARAQEYGVDIASLHRSAQMGYAERLRMAVDSANNLARLLPS